jgi:hypothetical protein
MYPLRAGAEIRRGDRGCTMGSLSMTGYAVGLDQEFAGGD